MGVSLTINGVAVRAEAGMTVLKAARAHGIFIPTLCYHPKLSPFGGCRLCVVEIERMRGYPTACTVPVMDGMVVRTETEALQGLRREILSLLLSEHPYTCLTCEQRARCDAFQGTIRKAAVTTGCQYCPQNGQCEIQDLVKYLDLRDVPYPVAYRGLPPEQEDPFFDRDYNLCILCGRCVRVCQEVRHLGILAFTHRGSRAIVGTAFGRSHLEAGCEFCGSCVDVCPTGTLADKRGKWEGVPTATVPSVCPYCSVGCAVNVQVKHGKVIRTVGHPDGPANDGQLCVRGRFGVVDVVHHPARLKVPLVRRDRRLVGASWDEALEAVARGLGGRAGEEVAVIASAAATNEETYLLQKLARAVLGSNNVALPSGFPEDGDPGGLLETLRTIHGPAIREVRDAQCLLAIGTNAWESHPILGLEIRHALSRGARLITVDTRRTELAARSHVWLQPQVGTDHVLLAGILGALRAGALPPAGLELGRVEAVTGVDGAAITAAARLLAEHSPAVVLYGSGVTHYPTAMETITAIRALASLLGGAGIIGVTGEGNFVGAHDMGAHPALLPGYRPVADARARAIFEAAWGVHLDPAPGRTYAGILAGIREGRIKGLYVAGEIPPVPELAALEFLVVQDILPTESMRHAHVVLPVTTFAETDGTLTNLEGRVQRLRQAIPPVGGSRPGCTIVRDVAQRILAARAAAAAGDGAARPGAGAAGWGYGSEAEVTAEIASLVPAYAAMDPAAPEVGGVLRRFPPAAAAGPAPFSRDGIPQFASAEFPFVLIAERNLFSYRGACLTEQVKGMNQIKGEEVLHLNPSDAGRMGIADGAVVRVVSPYGSAESVVHVSNGMRQGIAFTSINRVTGSPLFPGLVPATKACAVRIEKVLRET
jgi:predicted molibdopterin-dependent oxidoreductase YjgC